MTGRGRLLVVASAQLAAELAGLVVGVRRRHHFDVSLPGSAFPRLRRGSADHILRDALWAGTAYSAPPPMLVTQVWSIARLARGPDRRAARSLGVLGALLVPGHLVERFDRESLRPSGWDPVETPVVAAALGLAAAMAVLGLRGSRRRVRGMRRS